MAAEKTAEKKDKKARISRAELKKSLRLYKYIKPYRLMLAVGMLFLLLSTAASLAFPRLLGLLVDAADVENATERITEVSLFLAAILVLQALSSYFRVLIFVNIAQKSLASLRSATYEHLIKLPMAYFSNKRVGELNSRISSDIAILEDTFTTTLAEFIRQIIIIFGGIGMLLYFAPKMTLFMLAIVPVVVILAVFFGRFIRRFSKDTQKKIAESSVIVEETLQGVYSVKAFANEFMEILRYTSKVKDIVKVAIKGGRYRAAFSSFVVIGIFGAIAAVVWRAAVLKSQGLIADGEIFSFILYSVFIGGSIGGLANIYTRLQKAIGASEELLEIMDETTENLNEADSQSSLENFKGKVEFNSLSFQYPNRPDIEVLKSVSFIANPGEQIALVGRSGSGKSTLVSLLLQFYQPNKGSISFDDTLAGEFSLSSLRNQMAVVPQDVFLFGGTIRENILYGDPKATEDEIIEATKQANASEFIKDFPEGLDTIVGERGIQLSGGQRQRVAIARAMLKNPKVLILDEATSALDSESEKLVQDALDKLMQGRTSIIIAHRLSTIRKANKIVVLDKGEIVESGTHEELIKITDGIYHGLSDLQFTS